MSGVIRTIPNVQSWHVAQLSTGTTLRLPYLLLYVLLLPFVFGFPPIFCAFVFSYLSCFCLFFFLFKLRYFLCLIHLFLSLHCLRFSLSVLPPSRTFLFFGVFTRTSVLRDREGCIRYRGTSDRVMQIIRTVMVAADRGECMISTMQTTENGISFQKIMCGQTV